MWFIYRQKNYVKYDLHNAGPAHIFLLDKGGTGKSHLRKIIYNVVSKILLYHCRNPEKLRVETGETTIHSGLRISSGTKLLSLKDKSNAALRNRLSDKNSVVIDELSMVSSDLWTAIKARLGEPLISS